MYGGALMKFRIQNPALISIASAVAIGLIYQSFERAIIFVMVFLPLLLAYNYVVVKLLEKRSKAE